MGLFDKFYKIIDSIRLGKNNPINPNSMKVECKTSVAFSKLNHNDPTTKRILAQAKKAGYEIKIIPKGKKSRVIYSALSDSTMKRILAAHIKKTCNEIEIVPQQYRDKVAKAVLDNFYGTLPAGRSLLMQLQSICQISKNEASIIATDQTGKLFSKRTQAEQEAIGNDEYEWGTDGNPCGFVYPDHLGHTDHYDMDKALCKWSDASVYSKDNGKTWIKRMEKNQGATPGSTFLCRCVAYAKIDLEKILTHAKKKT